MMRFLDRGLIGVALLNLLLTCAVASFLTDSEPSDTRPIVDGPIRTASSANDRTAPSPDLPATHPALRIFQPLGVSTGAVQPATPTTEHRETVYRLVGVIEGPTFRRGAETGVALIQTTSPNQVHRLGLRDEVDQWRLVEIRRTSVVLLSPTGRAVTLQLNESTGTVPPKVR